MFKNLYLNKLIFAIKTIFATAGVFFGAQLVTGIVFTSILVALGRNQEEIRALLTGDESIYILLLSMFVAMLSIAGVIFLLQFKKVKKPWEYVGLRGVQFRWKNVLQVLALYAFYFVFLIIIMSLVDSFTGVDVEQQQELGISNPRSFVDYMQVFVLLAIIPPLFEEILFRGFLYRTLRKRLSLVISAVITCVLFGIAHLEYDNLNWVAAIDTMVFSAFLIYLVEKQQSLYGAILLHMLKNSIAFFALFVYS